MRISDWSSDVCSSDLLPARIWLLRLFVISLGMGLCLFFFVPDLTRYVGMSGVINGLFVLGLIALPLHGPNLRVSPMPTRSEGRRVGKECVSPGVIRGSPYHVKKKK